MSNIATNVPLDKNEYEKIKKRYRGKKILSISKDSKGIVTVKLGTKMKYKPVMNRPN